MKKMVSLLLGLIFLSNTVFVQTVQGQSGESNTPEEIKRLNEIWKRLVEFKIQAQPLMVEDVRHFNEFHHVNVNVQTYVEEYKKMYPRTSRYYEEQRSKRSGLGQSVGRSMVTAKSVGKWGPWAVFGGIRAADWIVGKYATWNAEQEQNLYNDLIDRGISPELAEKEANYQSDRVHQSLHNLWGGQWMLIWAEIAELLEEMNDGSRYNLEEYFLRTLAGPNRPLSPGGHYPISVGGDGAMIIGTPGPGGGCVIIGPGAMPGGEPSNPGLPGFEDEITVIGTPSPPC